MGLANVRFELLDLVQLPEEPKFDLITAFDVIHDQARPADVLARVHRALAPGGTFYMFDIRASSRLSSSSRWRRSSGTSSGGVDSRYSPLRVSVRT